MAIAEKVRMNHRPIERGKTRVDRDELRRLQRVADGHNINAHDVLKYIDGRASDRLRQQFFGSPTTSVIEMLDSGKTDQVDSYREAKVELYRKANAKEIEDDVQSDAVDQLYEIRAAKKPSLLARFFL